MSLRAQSPPIETGARIRVTVDERPRRVIGTLLRPFGDTISVQRRRGGVLVRRTDSVTFAVADLVKLEISRGQSRAAAARRGAIIVGVVSGVAGFVAGGRVDPDSRNVARATLTLTLGGVGAIAGAVAGALTPVERWETVAR